MNLCVCVQSLLTFSHHFSDPEILVKSVLHPMVIRNVTIAVIFNISTSITH